MNLTVHPDKSVVRTALDEIIHAHGLSAVLKALFVRSFRAEPATTAPVPLNAHLRRDIGLEPLEDGGPYLGLLR